MEVTDVMAIIIVESRGTNMLAQLAFDVPGSTIIFKIFGRQLSVDKFDDDLKTLLCEIVE